MFCPNCKTEFACEEDEVFNQPNDVVVAETSGSEVEIVFDCRHCGEQYVVTIAQEDLAPPKRTLTNQK